MAFPLGEAAITFTERGFGGLQNKVQGLGGRFGNLAKGLKIAGVAAAGMAAAFQLAASAADRLDAIGKKASELGASAQDLAGIQFAFEQAGMSAQRADAAILKMNRRLSLAAKGGGPAAKALDELGISAEELLALPVDQRFDAIGAAMGGVATRAEQAQIAQDIFGQSAAGVVRLLDEGEGVLGKYGDQLERLRPVTAEMTAVSANFNDAQNRMGKSVLGLTEALATDLMPAFTWMMDVATEGFVILRRVYEVVANLLGPSIRNLANMFSMAARLASPLLWALEKMLVLIEKLAAAYEATAGRVVGWFASAARAVGLLGDEAEDVKEKAKDIGDFAGMAEPIGGDESKPGKGVVGLEDLNRQFLTASTTVAEEQLGVAERQLKTSEEILAELRRNPGQAVATGQTLELVPG